MVFQNMVFQNGISLKMGKIAYELLYRGSSKYTIKKMHSYCMAVLYRDKITVIKRKTL